MANDIRIPPAVSLAFERVAYRICILAKLDYDEWHLQVRELKLHLQERWKEGIENGLNTERAEAHALAVFGNPADVAKSLRKPWLVRLLQYKNMRSERLLVFLSAYVFYAWMQVLDVHYRHYLNNEDVSLDQVMLPFSWGFFTEGMGTFFVGLLAVVSVLAVQWRPVFAKKHWKTLLQARYACFAPIVFAFIQLGLKPAILTWNTFRQYEAYLFYQGYCVLHVLAVLAGWFGIVCLTAELFGWNKRFSQKLGGMLAS
jgi:hypothetical protein